MIINELKEYYALIDSSRIDSNAVRKAINMVTKRRRPGKKLIALGMGLIILPEPTVLSDAIGLSLVAFGKIMERMYSYIGIKDVREEALDALESVSSLNSEMMIDSQCSFLSY
ncbi:MAG: hypothetical protein ACPLY9_07035 [Nitrososphaerales archaeon]